MKVTDPASPEQPWFEHDVGVMCPQRFTINFTMPENRLDNTARKYHVQITDACRTIDMMVQSDAQSLHETDTIEGRSKFKFEEFFLD